MCVIICRSTDWFPAGFNLNECTWHERRVSKEEKKPDLYDRQIYSPIDTIYKYIYSYALAQLHRDTEVQENVKPKVRVVWWQCKEVWIFSIQHILELLDFFRWACFRWLNFAFSLDPVHCSTKLSIWAGAARARLGDFFRPGVSHVTRPPWPCPHTHVHTHTYMHGYARTHTSSAKSTYTLHRRE